MGVGVGVGVAPPILAGLGRNARAGVISTLAPF